jgi:hypothetical protein
MEKMQYEELDNSDKNMDSEKIEQGAQRRGQLLDQWK